MPRKSSIETLPPDVLEKLQAMLRDPRCIQLDIVARINAVLAEQGHEERVSKSSLNRYSLRMDRVGEKLQQSRAMAEMWIAKLGAQPQGQVGHLINEILRTLAFDMSLQLQEISDPEQMPAVVEMLKDLSLTMQRLEKAASDNIKRETEIRTQAKQEAAEQAGRALANRGMTAEGVDEIKKRILGID